MIMIRLLIDICSAIELPVTDLLSTDAYVIVRLGSKEVHRTKVIPNSRNPIWTLETKSLFLLEFTEMITVSREADDVVPHKRSMGSLMRD